MEFCTTHWSLVLAAGQPGQTEAVEALAEICRTYWYPLYAYVRRRGYTPEEAQDLTQDFFARLLEKGTVQVADPMRGRFRSFLLAALTNFLNNAWDHAHTFRRGSGYQIISLDAQSSENRYLHEPFHEETPEKLYDRHWALTVIEAALAAVREEYVRAGKAELFDSLHKFLPGGEATTSYSELGTRLGLSESAVKVAVHRLRRRYAAQLRQVIAQTLGPDQDLDGELRHLLSALV